LAGIFLAAPPGFARPPVFKLGRPADYPPGTVRHLIFYDAFLVSDEEGIYAISSICTLRGGPTFYPAKDERGAFVCRRCHSLYDLEGNPVLGAARDPLPWLRLEVGEDGYLYLYRDRRGERGLRIPHDPQALPVPGRGRPVELPPFLMR